MAFEPRRTEPPFLAPPTCVGKTVPPGLFPDPAHIAQYAVLPAKPLVLAKKIGIPFRHLRLIGNRPDPFAERRKPDAKTRGDLTPCQAAGERDANRIPLEFLAVYDCHILSL